MGFLICDFGNRLGYKFDRFEDLFGLVRDQQLLNFICVPRISEMLRSNSKLIDITGCESSQQSLEQCEYTSAWCTQQNSSKFKRNYNRNRNFPMTTIYCHVKIIKLLFHFFFHCDDSVSNASNI